jgi:TonB family protein
MQKTLLLFKQISFLFVFSSVLLPVSAQEAATVEQKPQGMVFEGNKTVLPKYPGGEEEMYKFIEDSLVYPESAQKDNVSGRVVLRFFVDTLGNAKNISVQQGLTPDCNYAAINVVKKMPLWEPATQNGKKITGFITVPVVFKTKQVVYEYEPSQEEIDYQETIILDKKWVLVELKGKELPENIVGLPHFSLTMKKKLKVIEGNASCADFNGNFSLREQNYRLKFAKIVPKKKKCKGKNVDGELLSALKATTEYRIEKGLLTLGKISKDRFTPLAVFKADEKGKGKRK